MQDSNIKEEGQAWEMWKFIFVHLDCQATYKEAIKEWQKTHYLKYMRMTVLPSMIYAEWLI